MNWIAGKRIILTGASSGIGRSMALQLSRLKCKLALIARNPETLNEAQSECEKLGGVAKSFSYDLSDETSSNQAIDESLSFLGGVDGLILNAGISMNSLFSETEVSAYRKIMEVNFFGPLYCTKRALEPLKNSKGRVCVVSSGLGKVGGPTRTGYCASKHALHGFFDGLRSELHNSNVSITIACPGPVATNVRKNSITGSDTQLSDEDLKAITADECASQVLAAFEKQKREVFIPKKLKLAYLANLAFPNAVDKAIRKELDI